MASLPLANVAGYRRAGAQQGAGASPRDLDERLVGRRLTPLRSLSELIAGGFAKSELRGFREAAYYSVQSATLLLREPTTEPLTPSAGLPRPRCGCSARCFSASRCLHYADE